jgi:hypothetical protein
VIALESTTFDATITSEQKACTSGFEDELCTGVGAYSWRPTCRTVRKMRTMRTGERSPLLFFFGILENVVVYRWCNCGEFLRVGLTSSGRDWVFVRLT